MRKLDLDHWPRKHLYQLFARMDFPYFNLTVNLDITATYQFIKGEQFHFFKSILYLVTTAANQVPEFRYRIRGEDIVEHDTVHPAFTTLDGELLRFCLVPYEGDFATFYRSAAEKSDPALLTADIPGNDRDDLLFITSLPWLSYTSLIHPVPCKPADSVPRIAWGKYFAQGDQLHMPVTVQVHHGLMDGLHVAKFYTAFQESLDKPHSALA